MTPTAVSSSSAADARDTPAWEVPTAPGPAAPPATVREYREACLSAYGVRRGDRDDPLRYMTGAVYSLEGDLVSASQRSGGHRGDFVRAMDPPRQAGGHRAPRVRGRWLYGGHWMGHFGHFVTETLTTLWPDERDVDGILFHRFLSSNRVQEWQTALLRAAGWEVPVRVVSGPCVVESLVVPSRPLVLNLSAGPEAVRVWRSVGAGGRTTDATRRVFVSRSRLEDDPRRVPGDEHLDDVMRDLGFAVVHPEHLDVPEQLSVAAGADLLAGVSGSALHLSAFSPGSTHVLEIGDERRTRELLFSQHVIDGALGHRSALVPLRLDVDARRDLGWTREAVSALVGTAGLTPAARGPRPGSALTTTGPGTDAAGGMTTGDPGETGHDHGTEPGPPGG